MKKKVISILSATLFTICCMTLEAQAQLSADNSADLTALRKGISTGDVFTNKCNSEPADGGNTFFSLASDLDSSSTCGAIIRSRTSQIPTVNYLRISSLWLMVRYSKP